MSAAIAMMTRDGVVVGAESAITKDNGPRVYFGAQKIFPLGRGRQPVGCAIWGSGTFMGLPWSTLIGMYQQHLGATRFSTLPEYSSHFCEYLRTLPFCTADDQTRFVYQDITQYFQGIRKQVEQCAASAEDDMSLTERYRQFWAEDHSKWEEHERLSHLPESYGATLISQYRDTWRDAAQTVFEDMSPDEETWGHIDEVCRLAYERDAPFPGGFAIIGFGENEIFPTLEKFEVEAVIADQLRYVCRDRSSISHTGPLCSLYHFGTVPELRGLLEGASPDYIHALNQQLETLAARLSDRALADAQEEVVTAILEAQKQLHAYQREQHIDPVLEAMDGMPLSELAALAESLVQVACIRPRFVLDTAYAGGTIRVATITKSDGFTWIKSQ